MRIDIRQLTYFVAVAEEQHIGRAADRLNLSQPPLTRQIQQLESELGVRLFKRTPRGMELNDAGAELLRHARTILGQVEQAAEQTRRAARGQIGRLSVGVYGSAVFGLVPELLTAFRKAHPEVELVLHHAQTPMQIPALRQRRVQVVFERLLPEEPDIEVRLVGTEPLLLALAVDHPLAGHRRIDVAALREQTFITGSAPATMAAAVDLCRAHGFEPRFAPPANDVVTATLLASTGAGVSLVPASMTNVHFPGVVYRKLQSVVPATMGLYCFYLRDDPSPLLHQLLSTLQEQRESPAPSHPFK